MSRCLNYWNPPSYSVTIFPPFPQGLLFSTGETVKAPIELIRAWVHETQRVYGDRLMEDKDLETLNKLHTDVVKKVFEVNRGKGIQNPLEKKSRF